MQLAFKWSQLKINQNQKVKKNYIAIFNQINSMFLVSNFDGYTWTFKLYR